MSARPTSAAVSSARNRRWLWYVLIPASLLALLLGLTAWLNGPQRLPDSEENVLRRLAPYSVRYELGENRRIMRLILEGQQVTDQVLDHDLSSLPSLRRLSLHNSSVTDAGLLKLRGLKRLESLGIGGTKVTDRGLHYLEQMPSLRHVYVWQSDKLTPRGIALLQRALPGVKVHILN